VVLFERAAEQQSGYAPLWRGGEAWNRRRSRSSSNTNLERPPIAANALRQFASLGFACALIKPALPD